MAVMGETVRVLGMITCGENFHHHVQSEKSTDHVLVRHGIYRHLRHPAYTGYFYFSLGLQIMLMNPLSFLVQFYALHSFFKERIFYEELYLVSFFGTEYESYRKTSFVFIPYLT
jgi:protein-S-isoprenylcysteine O-methyltransferase